MDDRTYQRFDIYKLLRAAQSEEELKFQVNLLGYLVIELMREVEVLRETQINELSRQGLSGKNSVYGESYREIGLLTHNSTGPSGGLDKLFSRWVSNRTTPNGLGVPEVSMLERLEYTAQEIEDYMNDVEYVSTLT